MKSSSFHFTNKSSSTYNKEQPIIIQHNLDLSEYDKLIYETKQNIKRIKQDLQNETKYNNIKHNDSNIFNAINTSHYSIQNNNLFDTPNTTDIQSENIFKQRSKRNSAREPIYITNANNTNITNNSVNSHFKSITLTEPNEFLNNRVNNKNTRTAKSTRKVCDEDQYKKVISKLTSENKELKTRLIYSLNQLQDIISVINEIKSQKTNIELSLQNIQNEYKNDYVKISNEIAQIENDSTLNEEYIKLKSENESMKLELNKTIKENLQIKYTLFKSNITTAELSQTNNDSTYQLNNLKKTNEALIAKNISLENDLTETKENFIQLNALYNDVISENENALNKITLLVNEINKLKVDMDKLTQEHNNSNDIELLRKEMEIINNKNELLNEENKTLNNNVQEMIKNNSELNNAIEMLTNQVNELKKVNYEIGEQNEMLLRQIELIKQQQLLQQQELPLSGNNNHQNVEQVYRGGNFSFNNNITGIITNGIIEGVDNQKDVE